MSESEIQEYKENWKRIEFIGYAFRLKARLSPEPRDDLANCVGVCAWVDQQKYCNPEKDFSDLEKSTEDQRQIVARYNAKVKVAENGPAVLYLMRKLPMEMVGCIVKFL